MLLSVPPKDNFEVDPGRYSATCVDVREIENKRKPGQTLLRIIWELHISHDDAIRYVAGKNYEPTLAKMSDLREDLIRWFGHDINVRQFDTATLKGKDATITVRHIENEGWPKPYCWVSRVEPPHTEEEVEPVRIISPTNSSVVCG